MIESFGRAHPGTTDPVWVDRGPTRLTTLDAPTDNVGRFAAGGKVKVRKVDPSKLVGVRTLADLKAIR